jgi:hypothetical protein
VSNDLEIIARIKHLEAYIERLQTSEARPLRSARVSYSAATAVAPTTVVTMSFDTEAYDFGGFHSNSVNPGRLTIPADESGYYFVSASLSWESATDGDRLVSIGVNGGTTIANDSRRPLNSGSLDVTLSVIRRLDAGDYVEVSVFQTSAASRNILSSGSATPFFMIHKLSHAI